MGEGRGGGGFEVYLEFLTSVTKGAMLLMSAPLFYNWGPLHPSSHLLQTAFLPGCQRLPLQCIFGLTNVFLKNKTTSSCIKLKELQKSGLRRQESVRGIPGLSQMLSPPHHMAGQEHCSLSRCVAPMPSPGHRPGSHDTVHLLALCLPQAPRWACGTTLCIVASVRRGSWFQGAHLRGHIHPRPAAC